MSIPRKEAEALIHTAIAALSIFDRADNARTQAVLQKALDAADAGWTVKTRISMFGVTVDLRLRDAQVVDG